MESLVPLFVCIFAAVVLLSLAVYFAWRDRGEPEEPEPEPEWSVEEHVVNAVERDDEGQVKRRLQGIRIYLVSSQDPIGMDTVNGGFALDPVHADFPDRLAEYRARAAVAVRALNGDGIIPDFVPADWLN